MVKKMTNSSYENEEPHRQILYICKRTSINGNVLQTNETKHKEKLNWEKEMGNNKI